MKTLYLDCFCGISGNMMLGALISLGVPESYLISELNKLHIDGYKFVVNDVTKCGIAAKYVDVQLNDHTHNHSHHHHGNHHEHRNLEDIINIIDNASLDNKVKEQSKKVFYRLAEAEAKVHGTTIDKVHFHEVGAIDTIVDIVGTVVGIAYLNIDRICTSKLQVGTGFIKCSHGIMPVPAPATAELLKGVAYYAGNIEKELVTPTGAAIVAVLSSSCQGMPEGFIVENVGYGAGTWELNVPNVLRAMLGETFCEESNQVLILEANIDDLNPQFYTHVMDKIFALGALDVWLTSINMKKGRPAHKISVLTDARLKDDVINVLFTETSTIGVRYYKVERTIADRKIITVDVPWGMAQVKVAHHQGKLCNAAPEFETCKALAVKNNIPLKKVWEVVQKKAMETVNE